MKFIKSRKNVNCHTCKKEIKKGESYVKRSVTIGSPQNSQFERVAMRNGNGDPVQTVAYVEHGLRFAAKICQPCATEAAQ
jgi:hypothetical protein